MSTPNLGLKKGKVKIFARLSKEHDAIEMDLKTEDGSPLEKQAIIDIIGDYLLLDPNKIFKKSLN